MNENLQKIRTYLQEEGFDALFVSNEQNITYLTGFKGDSSRLFITKKKTVLITDGRYTEQAQNECSADIDIVNWINDLRYHHKTYSYYMCELGIHKMLFEGDRLSFAEFQELEDKGQRQKLISKVGIVEALRKTKSEDEIESLRKASRISDKALENILALIKPGVTELDIVAELEYQLKKCGAHGLSFDTMVLIGDHSSLLHGKPGMRKLKEGEHILFDFGALYNGYHADMSRVLMVGKANEKQK